MGGNGDPGGCPNIAIGTRRTECDRAGGRVDEDPFPGHGVHAKEDGGAEASDDECGGFEVTIQGVEGKEAVGDDAEGSTGSRREAEVRSPWEEGVELVKGDVLE